MTNRILLIVIFCLSLILVFISSSKNTTFFYSKPTITIKDSKTNVISTVDLEEYIIGVVAAEMPASFNIEALKAQAIASRTYATFKMANTTAAYDVVTDVTDQSYITNEEMQAKWKEDYDIYYEKIKNAVNSTKGMIMLYNDEVIEAYYFSMSNGYTEDVSLVFSEDREYLQSVKSIYDNEELNNFQVTKQFNKNDFCQKLEIKCKEIKISNINRSNTNRVNTLKVNDKIFKGTRFRSLLGLRSTDFDIEIKNGIVEITTRGYGHGVGMSQYGANGMAKAGYSYEEILNYYYKNIKITTI